MRPFAFAGESGNFRWQAQIQTDGKRKHLGVYESKLEAARAYDEAATRMHGPDAQVQTHEPIARNPKPATRMRGPDAQF
jgi:hypothetical protein